MKGRFWRKALAAALALLVVSGNVPIRSVADLFGGAAITASAEEGEAAFGQCGENAFWSFDTATGKMTIFGTGEMADYEYDFATDTMNSPWYVYKDDITSVEIKTGINYIGISAFYSFQNIESITIPNSVTKIGSDAFYGCTGLTSITIPENVTSIASGLFYGCTGLTSITIPNGVTSIGNYAFYGCESLTTVTLPKNLSSIGELTFKGCTSLESITIPASVTEIGSDAFFGCTGLTSITIPENVTSIAPELFYECTGLKSITIPESVTEIGYDAFYECTGVTDVYCYADPDKLTWDEVDCDDFIRSETGKPTICHVREEYLDTYNSEKFSDVNVTFKAEAMDKCGDHAYWCFESDIGKLTISGTGEMSNYNGENQPWSAYKNNITSVEIENGITSIGNSAFDSFANLTSVSIPDSVKSIGTDAFFWCTSLTSVTIPDSVKSIGIRAFSDCTGLTSITIPDSVTSIGKEAFYYCTNITDVYCYAYPDTLTWDDGDCDDFMGAPESRETVCHIPGAYYWQYVKKFGAESENPVNVTFDTDAPHGQCGDHAYWCFESDTRKLTISGTGTMYYYEYDETGVVTSPWYNYADNITSVVIENGITSISDSAFEDCVGLTSVNIPDSVTQIGNDAFFGCIGITDVYCYAYPANLTWLEAACDDFMGARESRETVCHVPKKYLDDYETKFGAGSDYPVNVRFVGDLVDMGLGEHLYGHSITLDGSIGVNFYVELTDELLASETAQMVFTVPNGSKTDTQTLLVKDVIAEGSNKVVVGGKTYYKFKCSVSAKDMASEITAQMFDGYKAGTEYKYSVKEYADYLLAHTEVEEYANAAPLVKAMLNYGAASQTYFKEGTAIGEVEDMAGVTVPNTFKFNEDNTALPEGVTFEGATLSLKSETTLSLYFKGLPADTKFTCDGKTVETAKNGEYVVARIRGIKASELENDFTVTFKGESMTYNAMAYCYNVLNGGSNDENLQNVCKALYLYAQAAKTYSE